MRAQAHQHIAAVGHGNQHRIVLCQLRGGLANDQRRQLRAVGAHQQDGLAWRIGGHTLHGAGHARTEVALALVEALHAFGQRNTLPGRIIGAGAHAQLHRADPRLHRLRQRVVQQAPCQPGGLLSP